MFQRILCSVPYQRYQEIPWKPKYQLQGFFRHTRTRWRKKIRRRNTNGDVTQENNGPRTPHRGFTQTHGPTPPQPQPPAPQVLSPPTRPVVEANTTPPETNSINSPPTNCLSSIIYANIQGLKYQTTNKVPFIQGLLSEGNAVFAALTETHIKDHEDSEVWIPNYNLFRTDRKNRSGGGVALYVKDTMICTELLSCTDDVCELLIIKISNINLIIILIYKPPDTTKDQFDIMIQKIRTVLDDQGTPSPNIIMLGDLNLPNMDWKMVENNVIPEWKGRREHKEAKHAETLLSFCELFHLNQHITEPTRQSNILDLIFTNNESLINNIIISETIYSDHKLVEVQGNFTCPQKPQREKGHRGIFGNFNFNNKNINWEAINQELNSVNWDTLLNENDPTLCLEILSNTVQNTCQTHIPLRKKKRRCKLQRERRILYKRRKLLSERLQRGNQLDRQRQKDQKEIESIEYKLRISYKIQEIQEETKAIDGIKENPKYFFSYAKHKSRTSTSIGPLQKEDGSYTVDDKEISNMLRLQYESVFSTPIPTLQIEDPEAFFMNSEPIQPKIDDICFTHVDIEKAIDNMPWHSAPGPDSWSSILLKNCKTSLSKPLATMWRKSLDTGSIPDILKTADIAPLHKGGSKSIPKNYRPIALTSHIIKIFERVVRSKITEYLESHDLYNPGQHGFRAGRSCLSQLIDHYDKVLNTMEQRGNVDVIYTDFAKAFDKCDHGVIAHKIKKIGITGKLGRWIHIFLTNRIQAVVVNQTKSSNSTVISSVPQGTVLAPLLFLILISDINTNTAHSSVSSFADDTKISMNITSPEDTENLQADINEIFQWANNNNMSFNEDKFQLMRYGNNDIIKETTSYKTESDHIITQKTHVKDLGVIMSEDLTFKEHNATKLAAVRKLVGWILRTFKTRDTMPMVTLFKSLVLSRIEYCSVLTSPFKEGEIAALEQIQKSFTAHIKPIKHLDYWQRLRELNLYSLERRRERYIIIYTWKILEGLVPNLETRITTYWNDRKGRLCAIPGFRDRGTIGRIRDNSLPVRGPRLFNSLPQHVRNIMGTSLTVFKSALDKLLQQVPDQPGCGGYAGRRMAPTNSLVDQVQRIPAWYNTGLREQQ